MTEAASDPIAPVRGYQPDATLRYVVLGIVLATVALSGVLAFRYRQFQNFVNETVDSPKVPPPWTAAGMTPETCVDAGMQWARECRGVKGLCDEYVNRVVGDCIAPLDLTDFCARLSDVRTTARFGQRECAARGVRREVDSPSCGNAYKVIAERCGELQLERRRTATGP
jgi:hypothetical protein